MPENKHRPCLQQDRSCHLHWELLVPAMMGSIWLDAAALGALVDHLAWFQLQAFDEFFCSVSFGHSSLSKS